MANVYSNGYFIRKTGKYNSQASATNQSSSYYDPNDPNDPKYLKLWSRWDSAGVLLNPNRDYINYAVVRNCSGWYGEKYLTNHLDYYYKFKIPNNMIDKMKIFIYPRKISTTSTFNIELCYGNENSQTKIGNTWSQIINATTAPSTKIREGVTMEVDFGLLSSDFTTANLHRNELLLKMYDPSSGYFYLDDVEIIIPDTSKIYIGNQQASTLYVGKQKASAVYLGTTKIL